MIQFNSLQTDAERDEQKGLMFLYKGIVGLRNSKAHSNRLFNDPNRAHEYLALASLLMRLLEIATVNRTAGGPDYPGSFRRCGRRDPTFWLTNHAGCRIHQAFTNL